MTFTATATYLPMNAPTGINFGECKGKTEDEAISILLDDIREFMRREESNDWWDDITVSLEYQGVIGHYPFQFWAKKYGWSY
jgi:hypothetical protein